MNKDSLSDERLVSLHQKKRVNAFFVIYKRYQNYGYAVVYRTLEKFKLINALKDERDAILYDSIMEALTCFDKKRGTFRQLLASIIANQTANYVREFSKDPLSDYVSLDDRFGDHSNLRFSDSSTLVDRNATPRDVINFDENVGKVGVSYRGIHKRRLKKMISLKEEGYSFEEIAREFNTTAKAVRAVFYRIKRQMDTKDNNKKKK